MKRILLLIRAFRRRLSERQPGCRLPPRKHLGRQGKRVRNNPDGFGPWVHEKTHATLSYYRQIAFMVGVGCTPRGRISPLSEHGDFALSITMLTGRHAHHERFKGRPHQGDMGKAALVEQFAGQSFQRTGGDDDSMSLRKMMVQLADRVVENQWLPPSNNLSDVLFRQCADKSLGPPQSRHPHREFNRQVARGLGQQKRGEDWDGRNDEQHSPWTAFQEPAKKTFGRIPWRQGVIKVEDDCLQFVHAPCQCMVFDLDGKWAPVCSFIRPWQCFAQTSPCRSALSPTLDAPRFRLQMAHSVTIACREILFTTSLSQERMPPQRGQLPAEASSAESVCRRAAFSGERAPRCCINSSFIEKRSGRESLVFAPRLASVKSNLRTRWENSSLNAQPVVFDCNLTQRFFGLALTDFKFWLHLTKVVICNLLLHQSKSAGWHWLVSHSATLLEKWSRTIGPAIKC